MADVTSNSSGKNRSLSKKPRSKKQSLRVDMTPMVDLAFLLISFFMLTIVISDPRAMPLDKRVGDDKAPIGDCQVLNILVDSADHVYTYQGMDFKTLKASSFDSENGIRQEILNKGRQVKAECGLQPDGQKRQMVCLIKLLPGSHYESMVRILDEMEITATKVYSLQEPLADEVREVKRMELLAEK